MKSYTVMVPYCETRQGTRQVCQMVPVTETRTVCEDQGHWEERPSTPAPAPCAPCAPCAPVQNCRCWVPNVVQRQVQVTCMRPQMVCQPCTYQVTLCRPETRTCTVKVCHVEQVPMTRQVNCTICVPQVVTRTENITVCRTVQEQQTRQYTVMVPYTVQKPVQVQVCKMVPQTVKVPVCQPCCNTCEPSCCQPCGCRHHWCCRRGC